MVTRHSLAFFLYSSCLNNFVMIVFQNFIFILNKFSQNFLSQTRLIFFLRQPLLDSIYGPVRIYGIYGLLGWESCNLIGWRHKIDRTWHAQWLDLITFTSQYCSFCFLVDVQWSSKCDQKSLLLILQPEFRFAWLTYGTIIVKRNGNEHKWFSYFSFCLKMCSWINHRNFYLVPWILFWCNIFMVTRRANINYVLQNVMSIHWKTT